MSSFDAYAFSRQPRFDEAATRQAFKQAVPLRTVVIHCYDPRAVGVPAAVARYLGRETYPGDIVRDRDGRKVASTTTMFPVVVAGGRTADALRSITVAQHLFGIENIAVVHHTYCGATSFTADGIIAAYAHEHHADISTLYARDNLCITDYTRSLHHDVELVRRSPGTPRHVHVYGFLYDIDRDALELVVDDPPAAESAADGAAAR
jgi:carbonic anhydrase